MAGKSKIRLQNLMEEHNKLLWLFVRAGPSYLYKLGCEEEAV